MQNTVVLTDLQGCKFPKSIYQNALKCTESLERPGQTAVAGLCSTELFSRVARADTAAIIVVHHDVELVDIVKRQAQEVMLVLPGHLALREALALRRRGRRISDLGKQIRRGCLSDTIHEHANERRPQHNCESKGKPEQHSFSVTKPPALLLGRKFDPTEVRFQLRGVRT